MRAVEYLKGSIHRIPAFRGRLALRSRTSFCASREDEPGVQGKYKGNPAQGGLCAKMIDSLEVKHSLLRGSPILSQKVAKTKP